MEKAYYGISVLTEDAPVCRVSAYKDDSWPVQIAVGHLTLGLTLEAAQGLYSQMWPVLMAVGDAQGAQKSLQGPAPEGGSRAEAPLAGCSR